MKILMVAPTPFFADRGCHIRIFEEIRALRKKGFEVELVTYHLGRDVADVKALRTIKIPWYRKLEAGPSWHKFYIDILLFIKTLRTTLRFKPDLIHAHLHEGCFVAWPVATLARKPLIFDCQGSLSSELADHNFAKENSLFFRILRRLENFINRRPNMIIVSSAQGKKDLLSKGIDSSKITEIDDGIGSFEHKSDINLREELNLTNEKIVIYAGALNQLEGIDLLLKTVPFVIKEHPEARFVIYGYPFEDYKKRAASLGLEKHLIFKGALAYEHLLDVLRQADIALAPKIATTEAHGKLYFYQAAGLPVVAFESELNKDILKGSAILVKKQNPQGLARGIISLIKDKNLADKLAKESLKYVQGNTWNDRINLIIECYEQLTTKKHRSSVIGHRSTSKK